MRDPRWNSPEYQRLPLRTYDTKQKASAAASARSRIGRKCSEETKQRMRDSQRARRERERKT
jgi:hypothetical protein